MIFGTGLLEDAPDFEPNALCAKFEEGRKILSIQEVVAELKQMARVPSRQLFKPEWIKNQAQTNGCTGWSAAGVFERARIRQGREPVKLAGAGVWTQINGGRNVGTHLHDAIRVMQSVGCPPESLCRELVVVRKNEIPQQAWEAAGRFTVAKGECHWADTEEELATGLLMGWTAGVAIQASGNSRSNFWRMDGEGILLSGNGSGNHAVGLDDVLLRKDGGVKFDMFNSWTTRYCDQGKAYVTWSRHLSNPVRGAKFYLVRATSDDPQASNPPVAK